MPSHIAHQSWRTRRRWVQNTLLAHTTTYAFHEHLCLTIFLTPLLDQDFYKPYIGELDILVSTIDVFRPDRPLKTYMSMLEVHGKFINVGLPDSNNPLPEMHAFDLLGGAFLGGSHIGSKDDCNAMLKLAAEKNVKPWVQELPMSQAKEAVENVKAGKVRYRYVLTQDIAPVA